MSYTPKFIRRLLGHHIQCLTHYGTFRGVVIHCTRRHLILGVSSPAIPQYTHDWMPTGYSGFPRQFPMGPMGPGGPMGQTGPMGPTGQMGPYGPKGPWGSYGQMGPGFGGPAPGGAWQLAIPLAAILGITAVGMHWW